jgi:hypothetical protein
MLSKIVLVLILAFAFLFSGSVIATVVYDLMALQYGWQTVSRETLGLSLTYPAVGLIVSSILSLAAGMLIGHLFLAQKLDDREP